MSIVLYEFFRLIADFVGGYLFVTFYIYLLNSYNKAFKQKAKVILAKQKKVILALLWVAIGLIFRFIF
ncbi:hypothetical protein AV540_00735 [Brevibacillus parabrevis]|nr:hypothetical protein AV540_00735 [Brevibacillus parabrevis]